MRERGREREGEREGGRDEEREREERGRKTSITPHFSAFFCLIHARPYRILYRYSVHLLTMHKPYKLDKHIQDHFYFVLMKEGRNRAVKFEVAYMFSTIHHYTNTTEGEGGCETSCIFLHRTKVRNESIMRLFLTKE